MIPAVGKIFINRAFQAAELTKAKDKHRCDQ